MCSEVVLPDQEFVRLNHVNKQQPRYVRVRVNTVNDLNQGKNDGY
ncbi:hypothetical protein L579_3142 [Pantoea sp. AS-PWVM4]|nr:hypothetical protein L579_3142 [Pantoea sp. AS-PWVM4]